MTGSPDLAAVAALIGDRTRAKILPTLLDGGPTAASSLAERAKVSAPLARAHLRKLTAGGLLAVQPHGRQRLYRLSSQAVADAIEALLLVAPTAPARSFRDVAENAALRRGRMCHDHIGGRTGVALTRGLLDGRFLECRGAVPHVTPRGVRAFGRLEIDVVELSRRRRPLTRACVDRSEQGHHLGGSLGATIASELFRRGWLRTREAGRVVSVSEHGREVLTETFQLHACGKG
ncbi:helix-turn-helix transcriptional regulator [Streptomyces sp. ITFR-16]|uniref:ArsR/SmtB family transcription factor n=1 Tax=Streptomyces sp. ITFR-16 TaxID=3075198 RepID=UPI00288B6670|nr:helix-turn-helix transcriptional regulator [Streptomyces sp. ITFR-16]WNI22705.1 helix-turn-helix transcriptional regulator [Streptomyces sp. ITFR-16]